MHTHARTSNKCIKKVAIGHSMTDRPHGHRFLYFLLLLLLFKLHRYYKSKEVHRRNGKGEIKWGRDSLAKAIKKAYIIRYKLHSRRQNYIKYILSMHIVVAVYKRIMIHEVVCKQHAASKIATKQKKCKLLKPLLSQNNTNLLHDAYNIWISFCHAVQFWSTKRAYTILSFLIWKDVCSFEVDFCPTNSRWKYYK